MTDQTKMFFSKVKQLQPLRKLDFSRFNPEISRLSKDLNKNIDFLDILQADSKFDLYASVNYF